MTLHVREHTIHPKTFDWFFVEAPDDLTMFGTRKMDMTVETDQLNMLELTKLYANDLNDIKGTDNKGRRVVGVKRRFGCALLVECTCGEGPKIVIVADDGWNNKVKEVMLEKISLLPEHRRTEALAALEETA